MRPGCARGSNVTAIPSVAHADHLLVDAAAGRGRPSPPCTRARRSPQRDARAPAEVAGDVAGADPVVGRMALGPPQQAGDRKAVEGDARSGQRRSAARSRCRSAARAPWPRASTRSPGSDGTPCGSTRRPRRGSRAGRPRGAAPVRPLAARARSRPRAAAARPSAAAARSCPSHQRVARSRAARRPAGVPPRSAARPRSPPCPRSTSGTAASSGPQLAAATTRPPRVTATCARPPWRRSISRASRAQGGRGRAEAATSVAPRAPCSDAAARASPAARRRDDRKPEQDEQHPAHVKRQRAWRTPRKGELPARCVGPLDRFSVCTSRCHGCESRPTRPTRSIAALPRARAARRRRRRLRRPPGLALGPRPGGGAHGLALARPGGVHGLHAQHRASLVSHERIDPDLKAAIKLERLEHLHTYEVVAE